MKKTMLCVLLAVSVLLSAFAANREFAIQGNSGVSLDKAIDIALAHAGASDSDVTITKTQSDFDDGIPVWEIDFIANGQIYEYEILATNGGIHQYSGKLTNMYFNGGFGQTKKINKENAKSIALEHAGLTNLPVRIVKAKIDNDDGIKIWEVDFIANNAKYEYDILASDGSVLEYNVEEIRTATGIVFNN
ncbi:MAG: PepSY domain-containing protein [Sphaerochaetaceae bacterium]|nr:PepSY domain-containing protein [Sphaerochaetaceae bacterium]